MHVSRNIILSKFPLVIKRYFTFRLQRLMSHASEACTAQLTADTEAALKRKTYYQNY